jgi:hypothetical protein
VLDRAALSRRVAALEGENDAQTLALHPILKLAEFDLKFAQFAFVFLALEFRLLGTGGESFFIVVWECWFLGR